MEHNPFDTMWNLESLADILNYECAQCKEPFICRGFKQDFIDSDFNLVERVQDEWRRNNGGLGDAVIFLDQRFNSREIFQAAKGLCGPLDPTGRWRHGRPLASIFGQLFIHVWNQVTAFEPRHETSRAS